VTSGTIFYKSTKPLYIWFRAIWWIVMQKNGVSAKGLQIILGIENYQTSWTWLNKFRRLKVLSSRNKLKGEVDETYIGGKKAGKRGRGDEGKSLVVIAVEIICKKTGRVLLSRIEPASSENLNKFILNNIESSSTIITDDWSSYSKLEGLGYLHKIQLAKINEERESILLNVYRVASLLKRWLLGTHQSYLNQGKMDYYLDEHPFRYNRRTSKSRGLLF
jgi:transposase-like protein